MRSVMKEVGLKLSFDTAETRWPYIMEVQAYSCVTEAHSFLKVLLMERNVIFFKNGRSRHKSYIPSYLQI